MRSWSDRDRSRWPRPSLCSDRRNRSVSQQTWSKPSLCSDRRNRSVSQQTWSTPSLCSDRRNRSVSQQTWSTPSLCSDRRNRSVSQQTWSKPSLCSDRRNRSVSQQTWSKPSLCSDRRNRSVSQQTLSTPSLCSDRRNRSVSQQTWSTPSLCSDRRNRSVSQQTWSKPSLCSDRRNRSVSQQTWSKPSLCSDRRNRSVSQQTWSKPSLLRQKKQVSLSTNVVHTLTVLRQKKQVSLSTNMVQTLTAQTEETGQSLNKRGPHPHCVSDRRNRSVSQQTWSTPSLLRQKKQVSLSTNMVHTLTAQSEETGQSLNKHGPHPHCSDRRNRSVSQQTWSTPSLLSQKKQVSLSTNMVHTLTAQTEETGQSLNKHGPHPHCSDRRNRSVSQQTWSTPSLLRQKKQVSLSTNMVQTLTVQTEETGQSPNKHGPNPHCSDRRNRSVSQQTWSKPSLCSDRRNRSVSQQTWSKPSLLRQKKQVSLSTNVVHTLTVLRQKKQVSLSTNMVQTFTAQTEETGQSPNKRGPHPHCAQTEETGQSLNKHGPHPHCSDRRNRSVSQQTWSTPSLLSQKKQVSLSTNMVHTLTAQTEETGQSLNKHGPDPHCSDRRNRSVSQQTWSTPSLCSDRRNRSVSQQTWSTPSLLRQKKQVSLSTNMVHTLTAQSEETGQSLNKHGPHPHCSDRRNRSVSQQTWSTPSLLSQKKQVSLSTNMVHTLTAQTEETGQSLNKHGPHPHCSDRRNRSVSQQTWSTPSLLRQKKQVSLSTNMVLLRQKKQVLTVQTEETGQSPNKHGPNPHCSDRRNRSVSQQTWSKPSLCSDRRNRSVSQQTWSKPSLLIQKKQVSLSTNVVHTLTVLRQKKQVSLSTNMVQTFTAQTEETGQSLNKRGPHPHCAQTEETGQSLNKHGPHPHCSDRRNRSVSQQTWSTPSLLSQKKQVSLSTNMVHTLQTAQTEETGQSLNKHGPHPHCSDRRNRSVSQQTWSTPSLCSDRRNRSVSQQTWSRPSLLRQKKQVSLSTNVVHTLTVLRQKKQVSLSTNMVHTLTAQTEETGQSLNKHGPHPHCSVRRNRSVSQQTWSTPSLLRQKKQVSLSTNMVHTLTAQSEETGQSLNKHGPHPHCSDRRNRSVSQQTWSTPSLLRQKKQVSLSTNMVHTLTAQTEETGQSLNKHGPNPHCSDRRNRSVTQQTWSKPSLLRQKKQVSLSTNMVQTLTVQTEETGQSLNKHGPHPHCSDRRNRSVSQQTWSKPSLLRQKKQVSLSTNVVHTLTVLRQKKQVSLSTNMVQTLTAQTEETGQSDSTNMVQTLTVQTEETGQSPNKHGPHPHCSDRRNRSVSQQTWSKPSLFRQKKQVSHPTNMVHTLTVLRQKKQVSLSTNMVQTLTAQTEETGQSLNKHGPNPHCAQTEETGQSLNKHGPHRHCSVRRNRSVSQQTWSKPSLLRQKKQVSLSTNMVQTLTAQSEETGQSLNKHGPHPHCSVRRNRSVSQQTWSKPSLLSQKKQVSLSTDMVQTLTVLRQKKQVSLSTNMVQTLTVLRQKKQVSLSTNMVQTLTAQSEETGQSLNKHGPHPHCSVRRNRSVSQQTWSTPSLLSQKKQVSLSTNMVQTLTAQTEETGQSPNKHGPDPHCSDRRNRSVSQQTWSTPSLCSDRRNRSVSQQT